ASWPRLAEWQREDAENVRMRDALRAAARQWEERHRAQGMLWRGDTLLEYRLWRTRYRGAITDSEEAFAASSWGEEARESARRRNWLLSAFLVLLLLSGALAFLARQARQSAQEAQRQLAAQYQDEGRRLLVAGEPLRALAYLERALVLGADG